MLALLLMQAIAVQPTAEPAGPAYVDLLVINQYSQIRDHWEDGKWKDQTTVTFYGSVWRIRHFGTGIIKVPVWFHCGWQKNPEPLQCSEGWAVKIGDRLVIAKSILFIWSDYDFEYRNRHIQEKL